MDDPRMDLQPLADELMSRGLSVKNKTAACPWHEDSNPSASILHGDDGVWRVFCHKCNRRAHVLDLRAEAAGRDVADLLREIDQVRPAQPRPKQAKTEDKPLILADKNAVKAYAERLGTIYKWYVYGPKDAPSLIVVRIHTAPERKSFRQFTPLPDGTYAAKNLREKGTIPLYRQAELTGHERVLVVEGEKAADAAWDLGIPATTSCMGAGKFDWTDWKALAGKQVILWPDADEIGAKHMDGVAQLLSDFGCSLSRIDPDGLGLDGGDDIVDLMAKMGNHGGAQTVLDIMAEAVPLNPASVLGEWIEDVIAGRWESLEWPLRRVGKLTNAIMPGALTLLCSDPGAGKSWLVLQLALYWRRAGHRVAVRMLEDGLQVHLARLLAHMDACADLSNADWIKRNPERSREAHTRHDQELADAGRWITPEDEDPPSLSDLCAWVEAKAKAGNRVIIVDPITGGAPEREPWVADFKASMRLKKIARVHQCSIILATHPRSQNGKIGLAGMAGGAAWSRFCHAAVWLERITPSELRMNGGGIETCNRVLRIIKSRHGRGAGLSVGLVWDENRAEFREVGVLAPEDTDARQPQAPRHSRAEKLRQAPSRDEDQFAGMDGT